MCYLLHHLSDNMFIQFGSQYYEQNVGIHMSSNSAPIVVDLFLFYYERDFMLSLSTIRESS